MFTVEIRVGNDAYMPDPNFELARNLREIADKLDNGRTDGVVMDINGNKVGTFNLE